MSVETAEFGADDDVEELVVSDDIDAPPSTVIPMSIDTDQLRTIVTRSTCDSSVKIGAIAPPVDPEIVEDADIGESGVMDDLTDAGDVEIHGRASLPSNLMRFPIHP